MNDGLIPGRYAKALFKFALEQKKAADVYTLMKTLVGSFELNPELDAAVGNPFVATDQKVKLLTTAAGASASDSVFADFLKLLVDNNRMAYIRQIALAYLDIYRKANHIYLVKVQAPQPLDPEEEKRLKALVAKHLDGGTMEYSFEVDPDLIGGFTVSIDNQRLDVSVRNELKQLRLNLLSKK